MSEKGKSVYEALIDKGIQQELSHEIAYKYMNTDYTATRMLGYLYGHSEVTQEMVVDEMIAILEDRDRFIKKHESERANAAISRLYNEGVTGFEKRK